MVARISCPVLVATGTEDVVGGSAEELAAVIPGAEALPIPRRDHMLAVGDRVYKEGVLDFLRRRPVSEHHAMTTLRAPQSRLRPRRPGQLRPAGPDEHARRRIVTLEPGLCVIEMPYAPGVSQQNGYFHGGAVGAIADSAAGYAAYSLMPAGSDILTVEYKLNLIRPALPPTLRAEGRVLRAGKTLSVCRADVYCIGDGRQEACALLQSTLMRLEPPGS